VTSQNNKARFIDLRITTLTVYCFLACDLFNHLPGEFCSAGSDLWKSNGPEGGEISALAIDRTNSTTLYAGTRRGIFKSMDGGKPGVWLMTASLFPQ